MASESAPESAPVCHKCDDCEKLSQNLTPVFACSPIQQDTHSQECNLEDRESDAICDACIQECIKSKHITKIDHASNPHYHWRTSRFFERQRYRAAKAFIAALVRIAKFDYPTCPSCLAPFESDDIDTDTYFCIHCIAPIHWDCMSEDLRMEEEEHYRHRWTPIDPFEQEECFMRAICKRCNGDPVPSYPPSSAPTLKRKSPASPRSPSPPASPDTESDLESDTERISDPIPSPSKKGKFS